MLALCGTASGASVKIKILADGTKVMYNERPARVQPRPPTRGMELTRSELDHLIETHARRQRLDPDLVRAVIEVESAYQPWVVSRKGAMGLMQLMPETARRLSVRDPWDPSENLRGGTAFLRQLLTRFDGQLELALAGYNAGPDRVQEFGGVPPFDETREYVEKVLRIYRREPGYSLKAGVAPRVGRKTYLTRDDRGRYVMTTTPVGQR